MCLKENKRQLKRRLFMNRKNSRRKAMKQNMLKEAPGELVNHLLSIIYKLIIY